MHVQYKPCLFSHADVDADAVLCCAVLCCAVLCCAVNVNLDQVLLRQGRPWFVSQRCKGHRQLDTIRQFIEEGLAETSLRPVSQHAV